MAPVSEMNSPPPRVPPLTVSVVVLPLPAQGHLNQLLHLARRIAARSIPVHYVGSTTHNRQARDRAHHFHDSTYLHFHDFPLPHFPTPPPNPNSPINFPSHLQPAFEATLHLRSPLTSLLQTLTATSRRVILIHDSTMSFAAGLAAPFPNVETFIFHSVSAFTLLFFHWDSRGHTQHPIRTRLPDTSLEDCFSPEFLTFLRKQYQMAVSASGRILNTCRATEGQFIDLLRQEPSWQDQNVFAIGPLNPITINEQSPSSHRRHECLEWLDRQPASSVVYVSFGTTTTLSRDQIRELGSGLVSSGQRFLWVLREADRGDIYANDDDSDEEEEKREKEEVATDCERGMIVRGWAPQLEILGHGAIGGFLSHCGWNSCMESLSMGVAMLGWPMHSDQPRNAVLVSEVLRVGIVVREWERRGEVLAAAAIREAIVRLMVREEGEEIRRRAKEVGVQVRKAVGEGGSSKEDMDSFIAHVTR